MPKSKGPDTVGSQVSGVEWSGVGGYTAPGEWYRFHSLQGTSVGQEASLSSEKAYAHRSSQDARLPQEPLSPPIWPNTSRVSAQTIKPHGIAFL